MIILKTGGRHLLSEEGSGLGEDSPDSESPEPSADCAPTYFCNAKEADKLYEEEKPQQTFKRRMKGYAKSHADPGCIRKSHSLYEYQMGLESFWFNRTTKFSIMHYRLGVEQKPKL